MTRDELVHAGRAKWKVDSAGLVSERSYNERLVAIGYDQAQIAAIDILTDDDVPTERAGELVIAAKRAGKDPEAFARHFVRLRKAYRGNE